MKMFYLTFVQHDMLSTADEILFSTCVIGIGHQKNARCFIGSPIPN